MFTLPFNVAAVRKKITHVRMSELCGYKRADVADVEMSSSLTWKVLTVVHLIIRL